MSDETLFAMPTFATGAARALDLGSTFDQYDFSQSEKEADFEALKLDWEAVGLDLYEAIDEYKQSHE